MKIAAFVSALSITSALCAAPAVSAETASLYPLNIGTETARFKSGVPTVDLQTPTGAVQITPLPLVNGSLAFDIAVYNKGKRSANIGTENITVTSGSRSIPIQSHADLAHTAKRKARRAKFGTALVAGGLAVASASATDGYVYHGRVRTPHGAASRTIVWDDNRAGMAGAAVAVGVGAKTIGGIQQRLDYTMGTIDGQILRTTTVEPQASFGGKIVTAPFPQSAPNKDIRVSVRWNEQDYTFAFRLLEKGQVPPPFERATQ